MPINTSFIYPLHIALLQIMLRSCCYVIFFCCRVQAVNPDNEYHFKNRMKACQRNWAEVFGEEANMFAVSPSNTYQKVSDTRLFELVLLPLSSMCDARM